MKRLIIFCVISFLLFSISPLKSEDAIIYTAHQSFNSRIYVLDMQASVVNYFEYENYRMLDLEVVDNEVYVTDAFMPGVYKFNPHNGNLELIIHDFTLYYFYGIAFDGTYFYLNEWDMNRYDMNGDKFGTASFDQSVQGSCWDNEYLWTMDEGDITCWDISEWPNLVEVTSNNFSAPTSYCRGLWFDGQYFWTAESKESLGYIYKFDYEDNIIQQWLEPAYKGWSACRIHDYFSADGSNEAEEINKLYQNKPNPVNLNEDKLTSFKFYIKENSSVKLNIYDVKGRKVKQLIDEEMEKGFHIVNWNNIEANAGMYFYKLEVKDFKQTRKMILFK